MASTFKTLLISSLLVLILAQSSDVNAKGRPSFMPGEWKHGNASFYGGGDGTGKQGRCGYEGTDLNLRYQLTALSSDLFNNDQSCGACFEVHCVGDQKSCKPGQPPLVVTAADLCADGSHDHLDLAQPAFAQIAEISAGIVPIEYRRIPCQRQGGIRFTMDKNGNPFFNLVTVWNVAGAGDVTKVEVKLHDQPNWLPMRRNWGQKWQSDAKLVGQALSFRVFTGDRRCSTSWDVVPKDWQFGQTFEGKNFR